VKNILPRVPAVAAGAASREMLRISCDKTGHARFARVPRWCLLEGVVFADSW